MGGKGLGKMEVRGDMDGSGIYKAAEMERARRMEEMLTEECQLSKVLGTKRREVMAIRVKRENSGTTLFGSGGRHRKVVDALRVVFQRERGRRERRECVKNCECPSTTFEKRRIPVLKRFIRERYGRSQLNLNKTELSYRIPRNNALSREYRQMFVISRQIAGLQEKDWCDFRSVEFFVLWMFVNILLVVYFMGNKMIDGINMKKTGEEEREKKGSEGVEGRV